jgi:plasmid maintenance system antidote protein VapI
MVNTKLYMERCRSLGLKQPAIARAADIDRSSLHRKVHNKENLTAEQILNLMEVLELDNPVPILLCRDC